ncbi:MAG: hypothetical protein IJ509_02255 [Bacilli bacterium]|nr:hypothetical protein [Bacilli bacterium]
MKKINIAKIVWVGALFLGLIVILVMVMDYKIHYQYKSRNKIYFYECSGNLCVTEVKDDDKLMYSYYDCEYEMCPIYKKEIGDSYVVLTEGDSNILFDYRDSKVISRDYDDYQLLNNNYIIVIEGNKQGVINKNNEVVVSISYEQLGYAKDDYLIGYNLNAIIAMNDKKYGIISLKDGSIIEEFKYSEEDVDTLLSLLNDENASIDSN